MASRKQLFVLGLRRSGTTIFWEVLRSNTSFRGYNEPFNPLINRLADPRWRSTATAYYQESMDLFDSLGSRYWDLFEPIYPGQELGGRFNDRQRKYLSLLLESADQVLVESTRCHFKIEEIAKLASPDAVLVHLYRHPAAFATSHLIPSGKPPTGKRGGVLERSNMHEMATRVTARARKMINRATFWNRSGKYDNWRVESVVGWDIRSPFFVRASEQGLDARRIAEMPAVGKLLAYWKLCYDRVEEDGGKYFGERYLSVNLERWATDPEPVIREVLDLAGLEVPDLDVSMVGRPGPIHQPTNRAWRDYFVALGIDELGG